MTRDTDTSIKGIYNTFNTFNNLYSASACVGNDRTNVCCTRTKNSKKNSGYQLCMSLLYFSSSKWVPGGPGDVPHQERHFLHPDGPQLGKFWNKQSCVAFDKLKLTNSRKPSQRDQVCPIF